MAKRKNEDKAEPFIYVTIDGRRFVQRRLVLAQLEQLVEQLRDVEWPDFRDFNLVSFYRAIGARMPAALAVILTEQGKSIQDKDLAALAEDLRYSLPIDEGIRAFKDFFTLNPTASIAASLRDLKGTQAAMRAAASAAETGSPTSS